MSPKRRKNKRLHFTGKQGDATLSQCAVASPMSSPREGEGGLSAGEPGCDGGPGSAPGQCLWKPNTRAFCGPVPTLGVDNRAAQTLLPEDPRESAYSGPCAPGGWRLGKPAADFAARHGSVSEVHRHREREPGVRRRVLGVWARRHEAAGPGVKRASASEVGTRGAWSVETRPSHSGSGCKRAFPVQPASRPISEALEVLGWPT